MLPGSILDEGIPIRSRTVVFLLVLTFLSPGIGAIGSESDCRGSAVAGTPVPADPFEGPSFPFDADSGNPCEGEAQEGCSCETSQPLFAELTAGSGASPPAKGYVMASAMSDPSATVTSEIFHPPLS